jgi:hypothetical protein
MADSLADVVARLRATTPALADVPDDVLTAEVARQLQARGGPSVGDALGVPVFRTSNEKDAGGAAVVRETPSAWTKAATIGAPGLGEHYTFPSVGEVLASDRPLSLLAQFVTGHGRPRSVANADPLGITAFHEGKAPPPMFLGTTEEVGHVLGAAVGDVLGAGEGRGLYSRVDDAVSRLPAKGAHPNKIATLLKSNGATAEELAYRQVPEFLASQGNATVTPGALQAHLDAHPAPLPVVKTRGGGSSAFRVVPTSEVPTPEGLDFPPYAVVNAEGTPLSFYQTAQAAQEGIAELPAMGIHGSGPATKFDQYQLPGGENYQEHLLTLPTTPAPPRKSAVDIARDMGYGPNDALPLHVRDEIQREIDASVAVREAQQQYRSSHFDEPNILVHTRSNTRTLPTGEPGRFVEEVQSDWHQAGKDKGYQQPVDVAAAEADRSRFYNGKGAMSDAEWEALSRRVAAYDKAEGGVPDAPFKETWPDLGLKQQLLEAAKDPDAQWLGFTSGQTQATRYDLSKQIARLQFDPDLQRLNAWDHQGNVVVNTAATAAQLPEYIGKEAANKLLATEVTGATVQGAPSLVHELEGQDLQVGGEGMHHFYDELLPKRLQKIVKPFGGTVERSAVALAPADVVGRYAQQPEHPFIQKQQTPAWIVRLTPAMKARILKEGLPLSLLLGAAAGPSVAEALGGSVSAHDQE